MSRRELLPLIALLGALEVQAADDTFRCGSRLVNTSMQMAEVLALCGEPAQKTSEEVPQRARRANGTTYVTGTVVVETWTYDRGSSSFPAQLRFEGGKLVSVELLRERS